MTGLPVARCKRATYENFVTDCPSCHREVIFNRASDLRTFEGIGGRDVECLHADCTAPFRIVGDTVNDTHELLLFESNELRSRKEYMRCILNLAQAYEVFLGLFLRVELVYKPFGVRPSQGMPELNRVAGVLHERVKSYSFVRMRSLCLTYIVAATSPADLSAAERFLVGVQDPPCDPEDVTIDTISDRKLAAAATSLKGCEINRMRNDVVHKYAYRPTRDEIDSAYEEARATLGRLGAHYDVHDSVNWYLRAVE